MVRKDVSSREGTKLKKKSFSCFIWESQTYLSLCFLRVVSGFAIFKILNLHKFFLCEQWNLEMKLVLGWRPDHQEYDEQILIQIRWENNDSFFSIFLTLNSSFVTVFCLFYTTCMNWIKSFSWKHNIFLENTLLIMGANQKSTIIGKTKSTFNQKCDYQTYF